jgi:hypothetical protein
MIYVTGSYSRVFAFDARTGDKKWEYDARLPDGIMPCCDVVNRGAAIHGDKIIFATLDAHSRRAQPPHRQGDLEQDHGRLSGRLFRHRRADDRQGHGDLRQLGR